MNKATILLSIILIINVSCKKEIIRDDKLSVVSDKSFISSQNIKTEVLESISDSLLYSTLPFIINDYLFITESNTDHLLHVIKIPEDKYLGKHLNSGSGPGEGLMAWTLYANKGLLGVYDDKQKKLMEFEFDSLENKIKLKKEYKLPTTIISGRGYHFDNKIYFMSPLIEQEFALQSTDLNGQNLKGYGQRPIVDKKVFDLKKDINLGNVYNAILDYNKGTFVIGYFSIPMLKIFNSNDNKWMSIAAPNNFTPTKETLYKRICYSYVKITDKYIYALYDGRTDVADGPQRQNTNIIYVFDHQGKPIKKIVLDEGIFTFSIYKDTYLYGIRLNKEGEFKLVKAKI